MSLVNTAIKPFSARAYHEGGWLDLSEESVKGRWAVFFFYPADFTFVCPTELGDLADHHAEFEALGVDLYGISTDTHFAHKAWHDTSETVQRVRFPLVGDPTGNLSRNFGVYQEHSGLALRGTFVMNPEGIIKLMEVHDEGIGRDASALLRKVQAAQHVATHAGEVCPARWRPGAPTLSPSPALVGEI